MKETDDQAKNGEHDSVSQESMLAIEVRGKDTELWERREHRFVNRLLNSFLRLLGADIRPEITANKELLDAAETFAKSAQESLKVPQLKNIEREASIQLKLAEAKEKEAYARKLNLEADKLEMEIERECVLQSQKVIGILIARGELIPIEKDGELMLVYKKRNL